MTSVKSIALSITPLLAASIALSCASGPPPVADPEDLDPVWRALSNPVRRRILDLLKEGPLTTGELAGRFPELTRFAVMQHLRVLEEAELVVPIRDGRSRYEEHTERHHDHLIDIETGDVIEFQNEEIERLQREVAKRLGYDLVDHRLELYGTSTKRKKKGKN